MNIEGGIIYSYLFQYTFSTFIPPPCKYHIHPKRCRLLQTHTSTHLVMFMKYVYVWCAFCVLVERIIFWQSGCVCILVLS